MKKLKKIWIDYKQTIDWMFVGVLYLILNLCLILSDNYSIYESFILSGIFILMTILAYIQRKLILKSKNKSWPRW